MVNVSEKRWSHSPFPADGLLALWGTRHQHFRRVPPDLSRFFRLSSVFRCHPPAVFVGAFPLRDLLDPAFWHWAGYDSADLRCLGVH